MEKTDSSPEISLDRFVPACEEMNRLDGINVSHLNKLAFSDEDIAERYLKRLWNVLSLISRKSNSYSNTIDPKKAVEKNTISKITDATGLDTVVRNFGWCTFTQSDEGIQFIQFGESMYDAVKDPSYYSLSGGKDEVSRSDSHSVKDLIFETGESLVEKATKFTPAYYAETKEGLAFIFEDVRQAETYTAHIKKYFPESKIICNKKQYSNFVNTRQHIQTLGIDLYQLQRFGNLPAEDVSFYEEWYWFFNIAGHDTRYLRTEEFNKNTNLQARYNSIADKVRVINRDLVAIFGNSDDFKVHGPFSEEYSLNDLKVNLTETISILRNIKEHKNNTVVSNITEGCGLGTEFAKTLENLITKFSVTFEDFIGDAEYSGMAMDNLKLSQDEIKLLSFIVNHRDRYLNIHKIDRYNDFTSNKPHH